MLAKLKKTNSLGKLLCFLIAALMLAVLFITVLAEVDAAPNTILSFESDDPVAELTVEEGVEQPDLPATLRAVVKLADTSAHTEEPAVDTEEPSSAAEEPAVDTEEPFSATEEPAVDTEEPSSTTEEQPVFEPAEPQNTNDYKAADGGFYTYTNTAGEQAYRIHGCLGGSDPAWFACDKDGIVSGLVTEIPVTWASDDYDKETPGTYTFIAEFVGYSYASAHPYALATVKSGVSAETPEPTGIPSSAPIEEPKVTPYANSISGVLWIDANEDGTHNVDEQPLSGYPIYLYTENDTDSALMTVVTDADGKYAFTDIEPGRYVVGVKAEENGKEYLLPLMGVKNDNKFSIAPDPSKVVSNPFEIDVDTLLTDISAGMRLPVVPQPRAGTFVVTGTNTVTYNSLIDAVSAINAASGSTYTITITPGSQASETLTSTLTINSGKNVTIKTAGSAAGPYTIYSQKTTNVRHFTVNGSLTLEKVILDGSTVSGGITVVNGNLTMNNGAVIQNCKNTGNGGGIYLNGGTFSLDGGDIGIKNNPNKAVYGGGICIGSGTFTMISGSVRYNETTDSGGGVYQSGGIFIMRGGFIWGNKVASTTQGGGGVAVSKGSFEMINGEIYNNTSPLGSGVLVTKDAFGSGKFTMYGGLIHDNIQTNTIEFGGGGGVHIDVGEFTMNGGSIYKNSSERPGGGVRVSNGGRFTMDGAVASITENTSKTDGGGVYVNVGSVFSLKSGMVDKNTAENNGGGVYINDGTLSMTAGEINENKALSGNGGGVYVSLSSTNGVNFSMTDGKIAGNKAPNGYGGGIYTENYDYQNPASVTKYANIGIAATAAVSGNTASSTETPPSNSADFTSRTTSPFDGGLLDNDNINYVNPRVTFTFMKVNEKGEAMPGVEFALYPRDSAGIGWDTANSLSATSAADGKVSFAGLTSGQYLLVETKALQGYMLPAGQWIVELDAKTNSIVSIVADPAGDMPPAFYPEGGIYKVRNYRAMVMPQSGGMGTILFTVGGIVLVGLAVILIITTGRKKK